MVAGREQERKIITELFGTMLVAVPFVSSIVGVLCLFVFEKIKFNITTTADWTYFALFLLFYFLWPLMWLFVLNKKISQLQSNNHKDIEVEKGFAERKRQVAALEKRMSVREEVLSKREQRVIDIEKRLKHDYQRIEMWEWILNQLGEKDSHLGVNWKILHGESPYANMQWRIEDSPRCPHCKERMLKHYSDYGDYLGYRCRSCDKNPWHRADIVETSRKVVFNRTEDKVNELKLIWRKEHPITQQ